LKVLVITSWSDAGYELYGKRWLETAALFSPEMETLVVSDADLAKDEGFVAFCERHKDRVMDPKAPGYDYRQDLVRFAHKVFALKVALRAAADHDYLMWLDGDIETIKPIDADFLGKICPADKDGARSALAAALALMPLHAHTSKGFDRSPPLWVRVNAVDPWLSADLAMCAASPAVRSVMVPKAESPVQMQAVFEACGGKPLVALIETAQGFAQRDALANHGAVARLAFGSIDFQVDLGIAGEGDALLMFRSALVLASRLAGLPAPLDGVTVEVNDDRRVSADAARARELGFGGKLCIHPQQVGPVNAAFSPGEAELQWAERVVAAMQAAGGAAVAVDGKMVDKPVLLRAQALLAQQR
jgi:citrate lyase subunit beta/citryl-CoA lyase